LDVKPPRLAQGIRTPGFKAHMQLKDLNIVLDTGETYHAPLPLSEVTRDMFKAMVDHGDGEQDNAAVLSVLERKTGIHVGPDAPKP